jgi:hypothetical protein
MTGIITGWRESSRSAYNGNCVEVGEWRKARRSIGNGDCTQVAPVPGGVAVRDSKDPDGPILRYGTDAWREFLAARKADGQ